MKKHDRIQKRRASFKCQDLG